MRLLFSLFGRTSYWVCKCPILLMILVACVEMRRKMEKLYRLNTDAALDMEKSLNEGAILLSGFAPGTWQWKAYAESGFFDKDKKLKDYTKEEFDQLVYAEPQKVKLNYMGNEMNATYQAIAVKLCSKM